MTCKLILEKLILVYLDNPLFELSNQTDKLNTPTTLS